jgi:hypothetical protein
MKKKIHVNQHNIKKNRAGATLPVFTVKTYKHNTVGHAVRIEGEMTLQFYEKPLSCGAHVWLETDGRVWVDGEEVT